MPALSTTMHKVVWHEIELHCAAESLRIAAPPAQAPVCGDVRRVSVVEAVDSDAEARARTANGIDQAGADRPAGCP